MEQTTQSPRILIIDDEQSLMRAIRDALVADGFSILTATNGEEGLQAALERKPDLIILDVLMPKLDGMSMLKKLRADEAYGKHAKVILLTNLDADDNMVSDIVKTEPTYYLIKSDIKLSEISEKIKEVLAD